MMVTFVSQCEKNALKKTRRVLDAFANRIGDNTWQTLITEEGLLTVKKMLRKTASKSTAVSCHWIRSRSRSQFLWVVGNKNKFNLEGVVPVNTTKRNLLNSEFENDWHYLPLIKSLSALAALLHDWGKATLLFQEKLTPNSSNTFKGDPIRHEWISLLLLHAFIKGAGTEDDNAWLLKLSKGDIDEVQLKKSIKESVKQPFIELPPIAQLIAWLIVSHHRLPLLPAESVDNYKPEKAETLSVMLNRIQQAWGYENRRDPEEYEKRLKGCFQFPHGLLSNSNQWLGKLKRWSKQLLDNKAQAEQCYSDGSYRLVLNHSRLCLMLGDHFYSSQEAAKNWKNETGLFANTDRKTHELKQKLDEHLIGVAHYATQTAHLLPAFEKEPPTVEDVQSLRKPSPKGYQWQDKAVKAIVVWQKEADESKQKRGFFAVNMASTGCGKTFANAKVMRALSDDQKSLRFILALGLRTLTLQTGREYRDRVGLDDTELAVLIGSRAVMELDQRNIKILKSTQHETTGSESQESLLTETIDFDCAIPEEGLSTVLTQERDKQFLYAPVLACTIDHIMAATETKRGGRYILPTLRLMSSDLVIDEIDDFTGNDLIAIGRLIHLAGLLGRKVMISSATIPPYMAEGYFNAYREGWNIYCKTRDAVPVIGCAWIDEFTTKVHSIFSADMKQAVPDYRSSHEQFIQNRVTKLKQEPARRKAVIATCQPIIDKHQAERQQDLAVVESKQTAYFNLAFESAWTLHKAHHVKDAQTGLNVSFGVMRVANIAPCVALTRYLLSRDYSANTEVRVMAYHSQQVLLMRSEQECHLDEVLKRKEAAGIAPAALANPHIRQHLASIKQKGEAVKNVLFVLVATPVEEVGRDHDFDWAVVEPSSYRSIVQLAGRVKRHRYGEVEAPNIALLQYNLKGLRYSYNIDQKPVFERPGFESGRVSLNHHNLDQLLNVNAVAERLDAIPRIQQSKHLTANYLKKTYSANQLVDLEHMMTWHWLASYRATGPHTLQGWNAHHWFVTALPQTLAPFRGANHSFKAFLVFDTYKAESYFCEKDDDGHAINRESVLNIRRESLTELEMSRLWLVRDFDQSCETLAVEEGESPRVVSLRYGEVNFRFDEKKQYVYNDQLGLVRK
ncbi:type I-F CRISPR-associated helicase Cas3f [Neptunomonas phycophila]|uniref:type I-F CRISPR-associated helicase Cas3f n=1 Tax=Neptunomonas phycophila TaxID=1572645 RepID=UPI0026E12F97|nr:type I-F CRISPR-associated helicase Cas3f [Neptunomonas phycophila]MDO6784122.1 type I-F CRISPR-associated helicase Cas3f [Neptunomonas phycophila]